MMLISFSFCHARPGVLGMRGIAQSASPDHMRPCARVSGLRAAALLVLGETGY
jgi:hypothetical protein